MNCNEYSIQDISFSNFNIKKIEIYGNYIFEKNEVIKKIKNAVEEFLNSNKDVDYLIAYYYPTYEDMNNNLALCCLILNEDIKDMNLTHDNVYQKVIWNEYYDFFSASKKAIETSYTNIFNEANKMLQAVDEAYFILYELLMAANYKNLSEPNNFQESLERWLIRAEHIDKYFCKLKPIVDYNFVYLLHHMNEIFYYFCIPAENQISNIKNNSQWKIYSEIKNAMDQLRIIHQQLTDFIKEYPDKEINEK